MAPPVKLQLFLIKTNRVIPIDTVLFDWHKADWISIDITAGIQELFLKPYKIGDHDVLLGVRFKTTTGKVILPDSILKVKSMVGQKNLYTDKIEQIKTMENVAEHIRGNIQEIKTALKIKGEHLLRRRGKSEKHPNNKQQAVDLRTNLQHLEETKYASRNVINFDSLLNYSVRNSNHYTKFTRKERQNSWEIDDSALTLSGTPHDANRTIYHYQIDTLSPKVSLTTTKETETTTFSELNTNFVKNNDDKLKPSEDTGRFSAVLVIHMSDKSKDRDENEVEQAVKHLKRAKRNAGIFTKPVSIVLKFTNILVICRLKDLGNITRNMQWIIIAFLYPTLL